jgi:hypothetical protein
MYSQYNNKKKNLQKKFSTSFYSQMHFNVDDKLHNYPNHVPKLRSFITERPILI